MPLAESYLYFKLFSAAGRGATVRIPVNQILFGAWFSPCTNGMMGVFKLNIRVD